MKRKHSNKLLLIGAVALSLVVVSGYGGENTNKVVPNHFQKENTTIDTSEINTNIDASYHKIPTQVRALTFKEPRNDETLLKHLFLQSDTRDKVNVKQETANMGLFK